ncbi:PrgI family protein [Candidatus Parcubacteria bacterium]|nr:PrgI family protein [Candidatus Parcubacteria bacterium]
MKFQLPQFIETEVNIIGPFTLKQFLWVATGAALLFLDFLTFSGYFAIIIAIPVVAVSAAMAFIKINDVPLLNYAAYALSFVLGQKRYIFKKDGGSVITNKK